MFILQNFKLIGIIKQDAYLSAVPFYTEFNCRAGLPLQLNAWPYSKFQMDNLKIFSQLFDLINFLGFIIKQLINNLCSIDLSGDVQTPCWNP